LDGTFNSNPEHIPLIRKYKSIIHNQKKIDFDDILFYAYRLLKKCPIISRRLSNLFYLICVDEYQDTQELQYSILAEIVQSNGNLTRIFFVGDICQAIYGGIGGIAKSKNEISIQFGNIEIEELKLSGNYRSNQKIIDYYSNYQVHKIGIEALSKIAKAEGYISYDRLTLKDNVHIIVSKIILESIRNGIPPSEICVMAPQWWMVLPMGRKLKSELPDIDFDAFGLSPFRRVRDNVFYKLIKLFLSKPSNSNYTLRYQWVNEFLVEIDQYIPGFIHGISKRSRYVLRSINFFKSKQKDSLLYLKEAIQYFMDAFQIESADHPLLVEKQGLFFDYLAKQLASEEFDYANEIEILKRLFNNKSGVVVSTCHGVKGEEYETVIAFGLLDGFIPNWNDEDKDGGVKLLYVMCSRAKNNLYLISEQGHNTRIGPRNPTPQLARVKYQYDN
jgi:DNA helicase II / ATP-dependent DNA helicase PcrA